VSATGTVRLFRAVFRKQALLLVRYPINTASQLFGLYVFFLLLFYGGQAVAGAAFSESLGGLVVGFFVFTMSVVAYSGLSWDVTREAQWGTLEQLYMSPHGFGRVVSVKVAVNVLFSLLWGGLMLVLMTLTTGRALSVDLLTVVPLAALTLASAVGVGFVFGGLALLYKRVENVFNLVQFAFVGLIAAPLGEYPFLRWLPLAQGSRLLQRAMTDGVGLVEMEPTALGVLLLTACGYLAAGYALFGVASARARRRGVLGHY
jgi:ABC-2 type transport system permease protein